VGTRPLGKAICMCDEGGLPPAPARAVGWTLGHLKKLRCFLLRSPWVGREGEVSHLSLPWQASLGRGSRSRDAAWAVTSALGSGSCRAALVSSLHGGRILSGSKGWWWGNTWVSESN